MVAGRQVSFYAPTKTAALAIARQARADAERGTAQPSAAVTVAEYLDVWLARVRPTIRARTYDDYAQITRAYIVPNIGRVRLASLTPGQVTSMLARVVAAGRTEGRAKRVRVVLSSALHAAQMDVGLSRNVASLARLPKSDQPAFVPEVVTPDQARAIAAAFAGSRLEPLVLFSIATGVRLGELLALRWQDVDLDARVVSIRHSVDVQEGRRVLARPKTDAAQRTIALGELALHALELRRVQEGYDRQLAGPTWRELDLIFASPTGGIRDRSPVYHTFRHRLERSGLQPIRWHALRRVFAAILQDQGVPLERVRDLLGHSTLRVTEHYAYTMPGRMAEDVRAVDAVIPYRVP